LRQKKGEEGRGSLLSSYAGQNKGRGVAGTVRSRGDDFLVGRTSVLTAFRPCGKKER